MKTSAVSEFAWASDKREARSGFLVCPGGDTGAGGDSKRDDDRECRPRNGRFVYGSSRVAKNLHAGAVRCAMNTHVLVRDLHPEERFAGRFIASEIRRIATSGLTGTRSSSPSTG